MKKVAALLLVLMMMFGLVACNNQAGENSQQPANSDGGAEETGSVDPGVTIPEADFTLGAVVYPKILAKVELHMQRQSRGGKVG